MWFTAFLRSTARTVVSGATMMHNALGPVWHAQHQAPGLLPEGRRGVDQEVTWSKRPRDGWVEVQGAFGVVAHSPWMLGASQ